MSGLVGRPKCRGGPGVIAAAAKRFAGCPQDSARGRSVSIVWTALIVLVVAAFVLTVVFMVLNDRARTRLESLGGKPDDPTRRHWWMRFGG